VWACSLELGAFLEDSIEGELFTNTAPFGPQGRLISYMTHTLTITGLHD
jgi:hypothetical protein